MPVRSRMIGTVLLVCVSTLPFAAAHGEDTAPAAAAGDPSSVRPATIWAQERLAELDASIAVLEKRASGLQGTAKVRTEAALKQFENSRALYRARAQAEFDETRTWTAAQLADQRRSLDEIWTSFQTEVDAYLNDVHADWESRRTLLLAQIDARQKTLQDAIAQARADATRVAADRRAAIERQIPALDAQLQETRNHLARLREAGASSWDSARQSYGDFQKRMIETYQSFRTSVSDAMK